MLKKIRIKIITDRTEAVGTLYTDKQTEHLSDAPAAECDHTETMLEGSYHDDGTRVTIRYRESELSGMDGSTTSVSFHKNDKRLITMLRDGNVKTALVFEEGRRHLCVYQTQFMPFDVCVQTRRVENKVEESGTLLIDYIVELRGAQAEHTKLHLQILPHFNKPMNM